MAVKEVPVTGCAKVPALPSAAVGVPAVAGVLSEAVVAGVLDAIS